MKSGHLVMRLSSHLTLTRECFRTTVKFQPARKAITVRLSEARKYFLGKSYEARKELERRKKFEAVAASLARVEQTNFNVRL